MSRFRLEAMDIWHVGRWESPGVNARAHAAGLEEIESFFQSPAASPNPTTDSITKQPSLDDAYSKISLYPLRNVQADGASADAAEDTQDTSFQPEFQAREQDIVGATGPTLSKTKDYFEDRDGHVPRIAGEKIEQPAQDVVTTEDVSPACKETAASHVRPMQARVPNAFVESHPPPPSKLEFRAAPKTQQTETIETGAGGSPRPPSSQGKTSLMAEMRDEDDEASSPLSKSPFLFPPPPRPPPILRTRPSDPNAPGRSHSRGLNSHNSPDLPQSFTDWHSKMSLKSTISAKPSCASSPDEQPTGRVTRAQAQYLHASGKHGTRASSVLQEPLRKKQKQDARLEPSAGAWPAAPRCEPVANSCSASQPAEEQNATCTAAREVPVHRQASSREASALPTKEESSPSAGATDRQDISNAEAAVHRADSKVGRGSRAFIGEDASNSTGGGDVKLAEPRKMGTIRQRYPISKREIEGMVRDSENHETGPSPRKTRRQRREQDSAQPNGGAAAKRRHSGK